MITEKQSAIGLLSTLRHELKYTCIIPVLKTNLLINSPADANAITTRMTSTMETKMATPIRIRGCIETESDVTSCSVGTSN